MGYQCLVVQPRLVASYDKEGANGQLLYLYAPGHQIIKMYTSIKYAYRDHHMTKNKNVSSSFHLLLQLHVGKIHN